MPKRTAALTGAGETTAITAKSANTGIPNFLSIFLIFSLQYIGRGWLGRRFAPVIKISECSPDGWYGIPSGIR
jgi:hypothetical protein